MCISIRSMPLSSRTLNDSASNLPFIMPVIGFMCCCICSCHRTYKAVNNGSPVTVTSAIGVFVLKSVSGRARLYYSVETLELFVSKDKH
jgi:hypothetical protein